ncbi:MAG TPA: SAM-dependent chlorinase/fluorinase [Bacteroidota bacterium]|nr:SAM-dependent chlorinase/fluorinase [Bacteroidota bacterium]
MPTTSHKRHPIALLTDFGSKDHYVGTVKAVILSINPSARIIDISHDVEPHNIDQAGYLLWSSYRYFPPGTIFVSVVDPGVGSSRKIIGVRTRLFTFLAPDNGLLDYVLSEEKNAYAIRIKEHGTFVLPKISSTFHGRDIFAPVAADLSQGISLTRMGYRISLHAKHSPFISTSDSGATGKIIHVDRFGNLVTNIRWKEKGEEVGISIGGKSVRHWINNFAEAPPKKACLIVGSSGLVEIVVKEENAAEFLDANASTPIKIIKT